MKKWNSFVKKNRLTMLYELPANVMELLDGSDIRKIKKDGFSIKKDNEVYYLKNRQIKEEPYYTSQIILGGYIIKNEWSIKKGLFSKFSNVSSYFRLNPQQKSSFSNFLNNFMEESKKNSNI